MNFILILFFIFVTLTFPRIRCAIFHPLSTTFYIVSDVYKYFRYRRWNEYRDYGKLDVISGLFGAGKTLILTKIVRQIYKKYNGRKVFDFKDKKWKTQHIYVISNVKFTDIPFLELKTMSDMLKFCDERYQDGVSVFIFCIDEMSTQLNSRDYKNNFSTELLNMLLTCRHYRFKILGTSQRFNHVDALVRQVTTFNLDVSKLWRIVLINYFDAWTVENVSDVTKLKPVRRKCLFIKNSDFAAYDTLAVVENFKTNVLKGNILSDSEILDFQRSISTSNILDNRVLKRSVRKHINT